MAEVLKKFGRYILLDQIAQGGMAEIYRARLASLDAAGRILVIKRIQASYGSHVEFRQMFKSEIKVTMGFNHPNIAQVYDFGEENEQPYIAMEWIDGKNLRQFLNRFGELGQSFPIDLAVYIVEQAASGLHYAHSFKDKVTGDPLRVVHRDISPQNILIAYEGTVKVIDFGIAKADVNSEATRAGVIKGKPSYLSPEQISGETLDGRSDLFALGTVLWELLVGKKLFSGENDLAVLKMIESSAHVIKIPSSVNPAIPKELDQIVMKALAKQRDKRYQTGEEFQRALHRFLYNFNPDFNPRDLSYYAKDLFKNEIVEDRKQILKINEKVENLLHEGPSLVTTTPSGSNELLEKQDPETTSMVTLRGSRKTKRESVYELGVNQPVELDPFETKKLAAQKGFQGGNAKVQIVTPYSASGSISYQSENKLKSKFSFLKILLGFSFILSPVLIWLALEQGMISVPPQVIKVWNDIKTNTQKETRIVLRGKMTDVTISVNGQVVGKSLPATLKGVPVGVPIALAVVGTEGSFEETVILNEGELREIPIFLKPEGGPEKSQAERMISQTDNVQTFKLRLNVFPQGQGNLIKINGKPVDQMNPAILIPFESSIDVEVTRPGYRKYKREFVVRLNELALGSDYVLDVKLDPIRYGYITIRTIPSADAVFSIDGTKVKERTPLEKKKVPIGQYHIKLQNEVLGMEKDITVQIQDGKSIIVDQRLEIKEDRIPGSIR